MAPFGRGQVRRMVAKPVSVCLFREPPEDATDKYAAAVHDKAAQHAVDVVACCIPVLRFEYDHEEVCSAFEKDGDLVFTSKKALHCAEEALKRVSHGERERILARIVYVVGEPSRQYAEDIGFKDIRGSSAGCAERLVEVIVQDSRDKPLFHLCGKTRLDTLAAGLKAAGTELNEVVCYETIPPKSKGDIPIPPQYWKDPSRDHVFVYFSPSGVDGIASSWDGDCSLESIQHIAFGKKTAEAICKHGLRVASTSSKPTPEDLADAIFESVKTRKRSADESSSSTGPATKYIRVCTDINNEVALASFSQCHLEMLLGADPADNGHSCKIDVTMTKHCIIMRKSFSSGSFPYEHAQPCPVYDYNHVSITKPIIQPAPPVKLGVAALIQRRGPDGVPEVLVTQRAAHMRSFPSVWVVPGGHHDLGETLFETGSREIKEETGIDIPADQYSYFCAWESVYPHLLDLGAPRYHHLLMFLYASAAGQAHELELQEEEVQAAAWLNGSLVSTLLNGSPAAMRKQKVTLHYPKLKKGATTLASIASLMAAGTVFALREWHMRNSNHRSAMPASQTNRN